MRFYVKKYTFFCRKIINDELVITAVDFALAIKIPKTIKNLFFELYYNAKMCLSVTPTDVTFISHDRKNLFLIHEHLLDSYHPHN